MRWVAQFLNLGYKIKLILYWPVIKSITHLIILSMSLIKQFIHIFFSFFQIHTKPSRGISRILKPEENKNSRKLKLFQFTHGGFYRWIKNSLVFFLYQKLKEILTRYSRTISKASKNWLISKIWRVWLKNWARHAHFKFKV